MVFEDKILLDMKFQQIKHRGDGVSYCSWHMGFVGTLRFSLSANNYYGFTK